MVSNSNSAGSSNNLINCRKCGALFMRASRDICNKCYMEEIDLVEKVKSFIQSSQKIGKEKVTIEEILKATKLTKKEFEELFERGRLFSIMSKITVRCNFCGVDFECSQKAGFICPKCLTKFSDKNKIRKINDKSEDLRRREKIARQKVSKGKNSRYGFIQNFEF